MNAALVNKLRLSLDMKVLVLEPPAPSYLEELGVGTEEPAYDSSKAGSYDFVLLFAKDIASLDEHAPDALEAVKKEGLLWICYPKGTSKIRTDLNRDRGWKVVTAEGWEGVSLVSLDDTWSAMRFRPVGGVKSRVRPSRTPDPNKAAGSRASSTPEELIVPGDLRAALAESPEAEVFFTGLAPSHRKEYIRWVEEAKREETRLARISGTVEKLLQKHKRPSDKS
jgi:hypothetical protein